MPAASQKQQRISFHTTYHCRQLKLFPLETGIQHRTRTLAPSHLRKEAGCIHQLPSVTREDCLWHGGGEDANFSKLPIRGAGSDGKSREEMQALAIGSQKGFHWDSKDKERWPGPSNFCYIKRLRVGGSAKGEWQNQSLQKDEQMVRSQNVDVLYHYCILVVCPQLICRISITSTALRGVKAGEMSYHSHFEDGSVETRRV